MKNKKYIVICPYCGDQARYTSSTEVYNGKDFGMLYLCVNYPKCDSFVGVHGDSRVPLGRMADRKLRMWKKAAHSLIDPYWKSKRMRRGHVYGAIARIMDIPISEAHIGMFSVEQCQELIKRFPKEVEIKSKETLDSPTETKEILLKK